MATAAVADDSSSLQQGAEANSHMASSFVNMSGSLPPSAEATSVSAGQRSHEPAQQQYIALQVTNPSDLLGEEQQQSAAGLLSSGGATLIVATSTNPNSRRVDHVLNAKSITVSTFE